MKIFAVILSLLTICLSSYPCCQEIDSCSEISSVTDYCENDCPQEESHDSDAPCSPFYTCGSCPGFTFSYGTLHFASKMLKEEINPIPYIEHLPNEVNFLSLKPPRTFEVQLALN